MSKRPSVIAATPPQDELTRDVLAGLHKSPKEVSPLWFYDELGSSLFDSICDLPEYYVTRTELEIMRAHVAEMARCIGPRAAVIEFGSGTSLKTRLLLDVLDEPAVYVPVDISRDHLLDAAGDLARDYPALRVHPLCADFTQPFELPRHAAAAQRKVVYFPGSTLGNFTRDEAQKLLARIRRMVGRDGAVLIGIDLRKDPHVLERAYNDAAGVTAEFNLNALRHLNRELGANFDLNSFEHRALWVEHESRIEMHLVSKRDQIVNVCGKRIAIKHGEHLRTEYCHKYTLEGFAELAARADLAVTRVWTDKHKQFSVQLLQARALQ